MPGYLSVEVSHVQTAWDNTTVDSLTLAVISEQELYHARRAAVVHVPQEWPHAVVCRNCHARYPCATALWGLGTLKATGWELSDLFDLLESVEAGGQP